MRHRTAFNIFQLFLAMNGKLPLQPWRYVHWILPGLMLWFSIASPASLTLKDCVTNLLPISTSQMWRCCIDIPRELDFLADCWGAELKFARLTSNDWDFLWRHDLVLVWVVPCARLSFVTLVQKSCKISTICIHLSHTDHSSHRIFVYSHLTNPWKGALKHLKPAKLSSTWGLVMSVQGCMHAQQQIEIDEIKKNGYHGWEHLEIWDHRCLINANLVTNFRYNCMQVWKDKKGILQFDC